MSSHPIRSEAYSAYTKIFWGLLVTILDLEINNLDLLLDPIGYLLVAIGCGYITSQAKAFEIARVCAFIMTVWSALLLVIVLPEIYILYFELVSIVDFLMVWFVLGGIAEVALAKSFMLLSDKAKKVRVLYGCSILAVLLLFLVARSNPESASLVILAVFVIVITVAILVLGVIWTARRLLSDTDQL